MGGSQRISSQRVQRRTEQYQNRQEERWNGRNVRQLPLNTPEVDPRASSWARDLSPSAKIALVLTGVVFIGGLAVYANTQRVALDPSVSALGSDNNSNSPDRWTQQYIRRFTRLPDSNPRWSEACGITQERDSLSLQFNGTNGFSLLNQHFMGLRGGGNQLDYGNVRHKGYGPVPENIGFRSGQAGGVLLRAHGYEYEGKIRGARNRGKPTLDRAQAGAMIASRRFFYRGTYEWEAKIPAGVATTLGTYGERDLSGEDDKWVQSIRMQSKAGDEHVITIASTGKSDKFRWARDYLVSKNSAVPNGVNLMDNQFHRFKFVWNANEVQFFVDDYRIGTSTLFKKDWDYPSRVFIGTSFMSNSGRGNFDERLMTLRSFHFTPLGKQANFDEGDIHDICRQLEELRWDQENTPRDANPLFYSIPLLLSVVGYWSIGACNRVDEKRAERFRRKLAADERR